MVASSALLGAVIGVAYSGRDGVIVAALLALIGGAAVLVAHLLARRRARLGPLRRQLGVALLLAGGQLVAAVGIGAALMFVSGHDAVLALVLLALAVLVAALALGTLTRGMLSDVERIRDTLVGVGRGERDPVGPTGGQDELADLARAADDAIARLAEAERAHRDMIAAVSHDLRTPLTSLRLLAEAVEDEVVDEATRRRYLSSMRVHLAALSGLIDDLFELSRLDAGDVEWTLQQVRLGELVGETVDALRPEADAKGVGWRRTSPTRPSWRAPTRRGSSGCCSTSSRTRSATHPPTAR